MQKSLLDWLVELMQRDYPEDWARLWHLAHTREHGLTEVIAIIAKRRIEQLANEPTQMPPGLLGLARPAQDHEIVGVAHDARAEASLQSEHLPSQHDLDPAPSKSPEEAARTYLRRYQRRGPLDPMLLPVEAHFLCGKFIEHFVDVYRDQMVGRKKGTRKRKPLEPALIKAGALRFDPDELELDGGALIIVDVRVDEMRSEPQQPPTPAPPPDAAAALARKLSGKAWVSSNFKSELLDLTISGAAKVLAKQSETAADCSKPLQPRYVEKVLRDLDHWPKAPRGSPKQRLPK
jgi:hypothetical protein